MLVHLWVTVLAGRCPGSEDGGRGWRRGAFGIEGRLELEEKGVVVVELTLAAGSVRQPIGERDAISDIIKSSHPATAIT